MLLRSSKIKVNEWKYKTRVEILIQSDTQNCITSIKVKYLYLLPLEKGLFYVDIPHKHIQHDKIYLRSLHSNFKWNTFPFLEYIRLFPLCVCDYSPFSRYLFTRRTKKCAICVELYRWHNIGSNKHQGDIESYHHVRARACKEVNDRESINANVCVDLSKGAQIFDVWCAKNVNRKRKEQGKGIKIYIISAQGRERTLYYWFFHLSLCMCDLVGAWSKTKFRETQGEKAEREIFSKKWKCTVLGFLSQKLTQTKTALNTLKLT